MKILVVAATREEISPSLTFLEQKNIAYLISGVGMLPAAYSLGHALAQNPVDLVIQVGIGGILDPLARLGEVYQITREEIFDWGAEDKDSFLPIESLGFANNTLSQRLPAGVMLPEVKKARGITVNKVHGSAASIQQLRERFGIGLVESMEGAAAFYAAEQQKIAVLQYRAISNYIEPRNRQAWAIGPAVKNLNNFLCDLLMGLS